MKKTFDQELNQFHYLIEEQVNARTRELVKESKLLKKEIAEFKSTEEIYRQLIEMANDAIFIADAETGIIIGANQRASTLLHLPADKIIGMHQSELHPAEEVERYKNIFMEHIKYGKAITDDMFVVRRDGSRTPVEISTSITEFKGKKIIQGIFKDVTERKSIEMKLKKSEEKFRAYYEKAPMGYQSLNKNGCLIDVNEAWLESMQYSRAEVLGKSFACFLAPGYVERFRSKFPCFKTEGEIHGVEFKMVCKDGSLLTMSVSGQIAFDSNGNFIRTHCILNDITEYRKLEREVLEIEDAERKRIASELHDGLGQILTSIAYKSEALRCTFENESDYISKETAAITSDINTASEELALVLKGISPVEPDGKGFAAALEELAVYICRTFNVQCDIRCEIEISDQNKTVISHLYRIVQESVTNAVKHSKCDQIEISLTKKGEKIELSVNDNGTGIPSSSKTTGMGLKIMKYRAGLIGASLNVQSKAGTGTSMKCTFVDTLSEKEYDRCHQERK